MTAKDGTGVVVARGELPLNIDGKDRVFVWEVPDVYVAEETAGVGVAFMLQPSQIGVKTTSVLLCAGILYDEPTITPPRVAKWLGKPIFYKGPEIVVGAKKKRVKSGARVSLGTLYALVVHFVNMALPDLEDETEDDKTDDEKVRDKLPPEQAAAS